MIITIEREFGSGGLRIGELLAQHYGIQFYDSEALLDAAQELGNFDEVRSFLLEEPVNSLIYAIAMSEVIEDRGRLPFAMMNKIASEKDCVIMGRCGNFIFRNDKRLTSVFIHADLPSRVERIARNYRMSEPEAKKLIEKTDKHRSSFHDYYTNEAWDNASHYQLSIDSGKLGIEMSAELIIDFIEKKKKAVNL